MCTVRTPIKLYSRLIEFDDLILPWVYMYCNVSIITKEIKKLQAIWLYNDGWPNKADIASSRGGVSSKKYINVLIFSGLICTPCNNFQINILASQLQSIGLLDVLNQFKNQNCKKIGNCYLITVPEKVSKCVVYQGDITLTFETGQHK